MSDEEVRIVAQEIVDYFLETEKKVSWEVLDDLMGILKRFEKDVIAELQDAEEDE